MKSLVATFKALSDPTRLRIVLLLMRRDLCVCELTAVLGLEQSRVSHQLRILRGAGLIRDLRDGKWIICRIPDPVKRGLRPLLAGLGGAQDNAADVAREDLKRLNPCLRKSPRRRRRVRRTDAGRVRPKE